MNAYNPADYVVSYGGSGDTLLYKFSIPVDALFKTTQYSGSTSEQWEEYGHLEFDNTQLYSRGIFQVYPLGVSPVSNQPVSSGCLNISDFKDNAWLQVRTTFDLSMEYVWQAYASESYVWTINFASRYYYYDGSGNFIHEQRESYAPTNVTLSYNEGVSNITSTLELFNHSVFLNYPSDAVYVVPCFQFYMTFPDAQAPVKILGFQTTDVESFDFECSKNMLVDQSETLHRIEENLSDLNDKADTIINGTPGQQDDAQDMQDTILGQSQDLSEAIAELEKLEQYDQTTVLAAMRDFLTEDGWKDVRLLLAPVLDWQYTAVIMLIVISLINLSIILFGR